MLPPAYKGEGVNMQSGGDICDSVCDVCDSVRENSRICGISSMQAFLVVSLY